MTTLNAPDFLTPLPKTLTKVTLPSRGIVYKEGPAASGKLTLTPMTLAEETLMASAISTGSDGIDLALKKCIQDTLDVNYLLSADKFFLFLMLRVLTYGREYAFNWVCTAFTDGEVCGTKNRSTVLIPDTFHIKYLADTDKEPFEITLPESQKTLSFRLQRSYDEVAVERYEKKVRADAKQNVVHGASSEAYRLARLITHVDKHEITENISTDVVLRWLMSLSGKDISFYADQLDYFTPGIDTTIRLECGKCRTLHEMSLPITTEFFRPKFTPNARPLGNIVRSDVLSGAELQREPLDTPRGVDVVPQEAEPSQEGRSRTGENKAGSSDQSNIGDDTGAQSNAGPRRGRRIS